MRLAKMHFIAQLKSCSNKNPHNSNETLKDWFSTNFLSKTHMLLPLTSCLIYFNYDKPSNYLIGCYIIPSIQKCRPRNLCLTHASMLTISKNPLISCFGGGQSTSKRFLGWQQVLFSKHHFFLCFFFLLVFGFQFFFPPKFIRVILVLLKKIDGHFCLLIGLEGH